MNVNLECQKKTKWSSEKCLLAIFVRHWLVPRQFCLDWLAFFLKWGDILFWLDISFSTGLVPTCGQLIARFNDGDDDKQANERIASRKCLPTRDWLELTERKTNRWDAELNDSARYDESTNKKFITIEFRNEQNLTCERDACNGTNGRRIQHPKYIEGEATKVN